MTKRPQYHFTPEKGWINDPNGCIYADGEYHLFFQHYPDDTVWGPMHWGHAVSRDLLKWDEKEIALYPDDIGYIFSGSAVLDTENISGLGGEKPRMIAMYTAHNPDTGEEQQCIAYSNDYMRFTKYAGNPVIANKKGADGYRADFRDPKMFPDRVRGGYSAVMSGGDCMLFYHTDDFIHWEKSVSFAPDKKIVDGIYECPDLIRFDTDDGKKYVLICSVTADESAVMPFGVPAGHPMQYFVGKWDGYTFTAEEGTEEMLIADFGTDNYAMVSFAGTEKPLFIGWAENWAYVRDLTRNDYRGKMTMPRYAELIKTDKGYRMKFSSAAETEKQTYDVNPNESITVKCGGLTDIIISVTDDTIRAERISRKISSCSDTLKGEKYNVMNAKRVKTGVCHIDVYTDTNIAEIFADEGFTVFTVNTDTFE